MRLLSLMNLSVHLQLDLVVFNHVAFVHTLTVTFLWHL